MDSKGSRAAIGSLALIGTHTPRQCGIASFTADLGAALGELGAERDCFAVALNDAGRQHAYPKQVRLQIAEADLSSYRAAADYLNVNDVDVVSLQHEFGIFGGAAGAHVLTLLRELRMPIVTTLHTVLSEPSLVQRAVMDGLCALSERLVVMSHSGAELLRNVHRVPQDKIDVIPHGIPVLPSAIHSKSKVGVEGRHVLLTFGLLSPDKGIELVIDALPAIIQAHPEVIYLVVGATHPHVKERHGEAYRLMLEARARRLGVAEHLVFHDRFVSNAELGQFLSATDIYITPYLNPEQTTSGALANAVGAGKAVISTPFRYARELLGNGRGVLVPWHNSAAIAAEVVSLIDDGPRRLELARGAAAFGRGMTWPVVARDYLQTFQTARVAHEAAAGAVRPITPLASRQLALPDVNLEHLRTLTDDTGVLQHAAWCVPRYEDGYCLDDNARALQFITVLEDSGHEPPATIRAFANRYLAFVRHAFDPREKRFRNFLSYARQWTNAHGTEDCHGRAIWALGTVIARSQDAGRRAAAADLFYPALDSVPAFTSPRAFAYVLLGLDELLRVTDGDEATRALASNLSRRLVELFRAASQRGWSWFEDRATYCNARLPEALLRTGARLRDEDMVAVGLQSLDWLAANQCTDSGLFSPIGSNGFFVRGGVKAQFDQQPVEACGMVSACLYAHRVTGERAWIGRARHAFDWFLGQNTLERWLYDPATGGCRDGLHEDRANENQGAESTLSFLMALLELRNADRAIDPSGAAFGQLQSGAVRA